MSGQSYHILTSFNMLEFNDACLGRERREGKGQEGGREGERERRIGLCSTDDSINGDMSPLIHLFQGNECDSVCASI